MSTDISILDNLYCEKCGRTYSVKLLSSCWTQCPCCAYANPLDLVEYPNGDVKMIQLTRSQLREKYS